MKIDTRQNFFSTLLIAGIAVMASWAIALYAISFSNIASELEFNLAFYAIVTLVMSSLALLLVAIVIGLFYNTLHRIDNLRKKFIDAEYDKNQKN